MNLQRSEFRDKVYTWKDYDRNSRSNRPGADEANSEYNNAMRFRKNNY